MIGPGPESEWKRKTMDGAGRKDIGKAARILPPPQQPCARSREARPWFPAGVPRSPTGCDVEREATIGRVVSMGCREAFCRVRPGTSRFTRQLIDASRPS
jgi:hypothetical protein